MCLSLSFPSVPPVECKSGVQTLGSWGRPSCLWHFLEDMVVTVTARIKAPLMSQRHKMIVADYSADISFQKSLCTGCFSYLAVWETASQLWDLKKTSSWLEGQEFGQGSMRTAPLCLTSSHLGWLQWVPDISVLCHVSWVCVGCSCSRLILLPATSALLWSHRLVSSMNLWSWVLVLIGWSGCKASYDLGLKVSQCHFCCILLAKTSHRVCPDL